MVGAALIAPTIPAQAVGEDFTVPSVKMKFASKVVEVYAACKAAGTYCYPSAIAFIGKKAKETGKSKSKTLEAIVKSPGGAWTKPVDLVRSRPNTGTWSGLPKGTFATAKVKKAGKYKVKLRLVIDVKGPNPSDPAVAGAGPWTSAKKLTVTKAQLRKTKNIRTGSSG
jgi:hypothetical protein